MTQEIGCPTNLTPDTQPRYVSMNTDKLNPFSIIAASEYYRDSNLGLNGSNVNTGNNVLVSNQSAVPGLPLNHLGSQISYSSGNYNNDIHVTTGIISDGNT